MIYTVTLNPALDKTLEADGLDPERINRARVVRRDWGGKGINVSRALLGLGESSVPMGFLGGSTGEIIRVGLAEMGLDGDFVPVLGETRTNLTIHDGARGALVKLNEAGPTIGEDDVGALVARVASRIEAGDHVALCGNLAPGTPSGTYARLIERIRAAGALAYLDSSGDALRLGCAAGPYAAKPNLVETEATLGHAIVGRGGLAEALAEFQAMGIAMAVISLGAEGAVARMGDAAVWARPPRIAVRSDIGAGDSLLAGLIHALVEERPMDEALRWAVAAGSAAAMQEGSGVCDLAAVEWLHSQVSVEPL